MRHLILALCLPLLTLSPVDAQPAPEKRAALERMLDALRTAPDEDMAARLEEKIQALWLRSSTPAVTLLMSRGLREMQGNAPDQAEAYFNDAIVLDPTMAEAWRQRGLARFKAGDLPAALRDIQQALKLEPRHFGAWASLAGIAELRDDWKAAYNAWGHMLEIDPRAPKGQNRLRDLKRKAFGDVT